MDWELATNVPPGRARFLRAFPRDGAHRLRAPPARDARFAGGGRRAPSKSGVPRGIGDAIVRSAEDP